MKRTELTLIVLAAATGRSYTPAQLQKSLFLITDNLSHLNDENDRYNFRPYDYGPFDSAVYGEAVRLEQSGLAVSKWGPNGRWKEYSASDVGLQKAEEIIADLSDADRTYIASVSKWVRSQSFQSLIKSIYEAYPQMQENSIFQG